MRSPACGLGSRTSDRFRTETRPPGDRRVARCLLPSAGLAFRPPRVSSPVLSTPAGKLASAAVRRGAWGGSASFRNGSDRWSGTTGPFPSRGGDLVLLAGCQPAKGPTEQREPAEHRGFTSRAGTFRDWSSSSHLDAREATGASVRRRTRHSGRRHSEVRPLRLLVRKFSSGDNDDRAPGQRHNMLSY